ncbi:MAG: helix-turn-helix transcriptional regulator [Rhodospirillales bacterium]|nr:helix-turn-helix transcriptional regulator [Rhodospirillales bacterium]MDH3920508.1 helix-turn-helix transcriptional regulator [Rhodospirillales bacterium]MDH3967316.1 helix-turn-helix transcriptional regulator [Rhodospirillales bacterium]
MDRNDTSAQAENQRRSVVEPEPQRWRSFDAPYTECDALVDAVDVLPLGVILVDRAGRVVFTNRCAADLLARGEGITQTREGRLTASRSKEIPGLKALIDRAVRTPTDGNVEPSGALQLSRSSTTRPLSVIVSTLRHQQEPVSKGRPAAIVLCGDPDRDPGAPRDMLAKLYGLTPCEVTLALELLYGRTLEHAAARLSISMNTARTHLRHVFQKTGTNRQSDLLRLVFRSPVALYL